MCGRSVSISAMTSRSKYAGAGNVGCEEGRRGRPCSRSAGIWSTSRTTRSGCCRLAASQSALTRSSMPVSVLSWRCHRWPAPAPSTGAQKVRVMRRFWRPLFSILATWTAPDLSGARNVGAAAGLQVHRSADADQAEPAGAAGRLDRQGADQARDWCRARFRPPIRSSPGGRRRSGQRARLRSRPARGGRADRNPGGTSRRRSARP